MYNCIFFTERERERGTRTDQHPFMRGNDLIERERKRCVPVKGNVYKCAVLYSLMTL